ncbi:MAG: hypothetical protein ACRD0K_25170 [Egibacteraceae bacterium]
MSTTAPRALLWRVLAGQRWDVAVGSVLMMVHQVAEAMVAVVIGVVIDRAIATGDAASMARWIAALAVLFVGLSASATRWICLFEWAWKRAAHEVRLAVARRVLDAGGGVDAVALPRGADQPSGSTVRKVRGTSSLSALTTPASSRRRSCRR